MQFKWTAVAALIGCLLSFGVQAQTPDSLPGCVYNLTPPVLATGQTAPWQCDINGKLLATGGGGGGIPGGSNLQVQYNNVGAFGGYTNTQLTALINPATSSLTGALPAFPGNTTTYFRGDGTYATLNCAALASVGTGCSAAVAGSTGQVGVFSGALMLTSYAGLTYTDPGQLAVALGTITTNLKAISITGTFNAIGTTFDAPLFMNIINTASAAGSLLADFQVASASVWNVGKAGNATSILNNLGLTSTDGLLLTNTTAATVGAQQWSPRLHFTGSGWKTNATAGAQTVDWIMEIQPVQSTTSTANNLVWSSQNSAGGYLIQMALNIGGNATSANSLVLGSVASGTVVNLLPGNDGSGTLGSSTFRWGNIFSFGNLAFSATASNISWSGDTFIVRDAAGILGLSNGAADTGTVTSPASQRIYNSASSSLANYERGVFGWTDTSNVLTIGTQAGGTGTTRGLQIATGGTNAITVSSAQLVALPAITADTAHTDASVCEDTTTHALYSGSGTLGICLGTSGAQFKRLLDGPMSIGLREIVALSMHDYYYLPGHGDNGARIQYGPTAQEVEAVPGLVHLVGHANGEAINYDSGALLMASVRAIQELNAEFETYRRDHP